MSKPSHRRRSAAFILGLLGGLMAGGAASAQTDTPMKYQIPSTISPEAKARFALLLPAQAQAASLQRKQPATAADWDRLNAQFDAAIGPLAKAYVATLHVTMKDDTLGGVPVVRITPPGYRPSGRVLLYAHGGGYVLFSAHGAIVVPSLMAVATGDEVISIDYTLAPRGTWRSVTDQVLAVYREAIKRHRPDQIGFFGDSAGGGLVAGSVLKMRDQGLPLPGALCLLSPWSDITATGDTYMTLAAADPSLTETTLKWGADVYAAPTDQKNPYVSPVYGDYSKPFPPTLIQGGTREIFLSNFVRQYQAIRGGGHEAVLDIYEGMPHVFQATAPSIPETATAMRRAAAFFDLHLHR